MVRLLPAGILKKVTFHLNYCFVTPVKPHKGKRIIKSIAVIHTSDFGSHKKIKLKQSTWSFSIPREGFTGDVLGLTTGEPEEDPALGTGSERVG